MKRLLILALLAGCATGQSSYITALNEDSARVKHIEKHVQDLSDEQRRVIARYADLAGVYKPGIADDLKEALSDNRRAAYTTQLNIVHEFAIVQDKLASDRVFNSRALVIEAQSEIQGTQIELMATRQKYNFAASVYLQRAKRAGQKPIEITWFSDYNGAESARSATVFDDDGD